MIDSPGERLEDRLVNYVAGIDGRVVVVEHVPARVNQETGERFFSPETVERVQRIVWEGRAPVRTIQTPVFEFAAQPEPPSGTTHHRAPPPQAAGSAMIVYLGGGCAGGAPAGGAGATGMAGSRTQVSRPGVR